jgi:bisphosphoglycerate-independent phosphoglycerate mutase (AlkP superfamily)
VTIQAATGVSAQGPLVLIVRDGWGVVDEDPDTARRHGNGVLLARLPVLEHVLKTYPHCLLQRPAKRWGCRPDKWAIARSDIRTWAPGE